VSTPTTAKPWPRLSETLTYPPDVCQRCGNGQLWTDGEPADWFVDASTGQLYRWQEHDENDQREPILIVLCEDCAKRIIERHPRLYRQLQPHEPFPGAMPLCRDCVHRNELRCEHPDAKANGGSGLELIFPKPDRMHVLTSPRRNSGWRTCFMGPVKHRVGREVSGQVAAEGESL
jgi:hypothetical protein